MTLAGDFRLAARLCNAQLPALGATLALISVLALAVPARPQGKGSLKAVHARLAEHVRHQLVMLPYYSVFDNLEFRIEGVDTVVLSGQVMRPSLKSDAESTVRRLEGVGKVVNSIEVLPLSPNDDRIRRAVHHAISAKPGLDRYFLRAVPPIHIIVKDGNVTLVGVVASQVDKDLAGLAAREVPGVFSLTNNLRVENPSR